MNRWMVTTGSNVRLRKTWEPDDRRRESPRQEEVGGNARLIERREKRDCEPSVASCERVS